jgi:uncharacterized repeat protein (TIGR01451 family)
VWAWGQRGSPRGREKEANVKKRTALSTFTLLVLLAGLVSGMLQNLIAPYQAGAEPEDALGEAWVARYNGPGSEGDAALAIAVDASGNVYVTGPSIGTGDDRDYATLKYDSSGNQLWVARYDGPGNADDYAWGIALDETGNVYVTGHSLSAGGDNDYATLKYDSSGNQLWVARYDGPAHLDDGAYDIALDVFGNVYVTGSSTGIGGNQDYATAKYDGATGEQIWASRYNGPGNDRDDATAIAVDAAGGVYVTGCSSGDYLTIRYSAVSGDEVWTARYDGPLSGGDSPGIWGLGSPLVVDDAGNVYVTGTSEGLGGSRDYATIKYDSAGNQIWVARYSSPTNGIDEAIAIAVDASGNVYVTGGSEGRVTSEVLRGVWANSTTDVFAVGMRGTILRYDGAAWSPMTSGTSLALYGVWGSSPTDVFAVGQGGILHYDGAAWSPMTSGTSIGFVGVWGSSPTDIFAVTEGGTIRHYDGAAWGPMTTGTDAWLFSVWGSSPTDVFAVGQDGTILHYDGAAWSPMTSGTSIILQGVWGSSPTDVFAVGQDGTILHYDGDTWSPMTSGTSMPLSDVWGSSPTDVFAVGGGGTILHYDGDTWSPMTSGTGMGVYGVWGSSPTDVFAVGGGGTILHYDGATWSEIGFNYDCATVAYNSVGDELWVARYDGPGNAVDFAWGIALDETGNVYITGTSGGLGGGRDYATIKYDSAGNQLWVARYDSPAGRSDEASAIAVDASGSVYVTGVSQGVGTGDDYATIKYASTGLTVSVSPTEIPTPSDSQYVPLQDIPLQDIPVQDIPMANLVLRDISLESSPLQHIPLQHIPLQHIDWETLLAGTSFEGTPLQHITLGDLLLAGIPLQHITLADIFLAGIPVQDIVAESAPLQHISLQDIPLQHIDWESILAGTDLEGTNLQEISLRDLLLASVPLQHIPLQYIDILGSPLQHIPLSDIPLQYITWESILLGTPLQHIPLEEITLGDLVLNNIPLQHITLLNILLVGVPLQHIPLQHIPLQHISILGTPLQHIPLQHIPLQHITWPELLQGTVWENADLSTTSLGDLSLAVSPLQHITLQDIVNAGTPLEDIPLDIPLEEIDIVGTPLQYIALQDIPLQYITWESILAGTTLEGANLAQITLGDVVLAGISLQAGDPPQPITVEDIVLAGVPLQHIPLQHINILESPLQHIPLQHIPLQHITWPELLQGTVWEGANLGETTLGDIARAGIPLQHISLWDALMALVPLADIPWEAVPLQHIPLEQNVVTYTITLFNYGDVNGQDVFITHVLPAGFEYVAGSTTGLTNADPVIAGQELTWGPFTAEAGGKAVLQFKAAATVSLGTHFCSVLVTSSNLTIPPALNVAPLRVVDSFEPNDDWSQAQDVSSDRLYLSYITSETDVDWYKIPVPPDKGTMVTVYLSHLSVDCDLALFAALEDLPTDIGLQDVPLQDMPLRDIPLEEVPPQDTTALDTKLDDIALQDIPLQGIPLQHIPLQHISIERGTSDEIVGDKVFNETGCYYILVSGYNGAHSDEPYMLRVKTTPPPGIELHTRSLPPVTAAGSLYEPYGQDTETIILSNQKRLEQYYPGSVFDQGGLKDELEAFALRTDVKGMIIPLESYASVANAYDAWDANTGDPEAANAVAAEIRAVLKTLLNLHPGVKYLVIAGSDEIVPLCRVPDEVYLSNEAKYAAASHLDASSALYAAFIHGYVLTDDYYADMAPVSWMGRELYVPDYAIGRLVETPDEIVKMLNAFAANEGKLTVTSALVTGYDFLSDGASAIADVLEGHDIAVIDLISEGWTAEDLMQHLLSSPDIASINAHCNHWQIGPAVGSPFQSDQILVSYVGGELVFSMGCHAGLNVSDNVSIAGPWSLDLAQALARSGAWFVGNTGYGYGDSDIVALSEKLMGNFAASLVSNESVAVGQALLEAKRNYYLNMGTYGAFDEKIMIESTLYGLPMYQIDPDAAAPAAAGEPDAHLTIQANRLGGASGSLTEQVPLFLNTSARGQFYSAWTAAGYCQFTPYRPIQPQTSLDISYAGQVAHGVLFTGGTYQEYYAFDPVVARPVDAQSLYEPQFINEGWYPSKMQTIMSLETLGTLQQSLVVMPGQFVTTSADTKVTGTERLYTSLNYDIYYSTSTDYQSPIIRLVNAAASRAGLSDVFDAYFRVTVSDNEAVSKVFVTWTYHSGDTTWRTIELTYDATSGAWRGELPSLSGGQIDYLVQAVDEAGNIAVSTCKGLLFNSFPPKVSVNFEVNVYEGSPCEGGGHSPTRAAASGVRL